MIISDQQAQAVAQEAHHPHLHAAHRSETVPAEVIHEAMERAAHTPDVRPERMADAMKRLEAGELDPHEIAEKIISRVLTDSLALRAL